ncbi:sensor histidine kinase [Photobacterium galatheae]|uniref:C4-dicarboxylate transport sensor protein DctB n=1 Tax=Photobacterium galatheae TaxID=1654360 RepID=A0A066RID3_9GAMM|nr:ATP-binding protein [Photobacterium galatheae]KDM90089.1 ATPase [Photobacterium galatheae]
MPKKTTLGLLTGLGILLSIMIGLITHQHFIHAMSKQIKYDISSLGEKLDQRLKRYQQLPQLLAHDPRLLDSLMAAAAPKAERDAKLLQTNLLLAYWSKTLLADTIYLLDTKGDTLAASNWQEKDSFVGSNYDYRPYFQDAMNGQLGQFFALGISSQKRGYFFSAPVYDQAKQVNGVIVIKIDLDLVDEIWQYQDLEYVISDPYGVIFYSSIHSWIYHSLVPLSETQKQSVLERRQYGEPPLTALTEIADLNELNTNRQAMILLPQQQKRQSFLYAHHDMNTAGWVIYGFMPTYQILSDVFESILLFIAFYILLVLVLIYWWQTFSAKEALAELNDTLEEQVADRTQHLHQANKQLWHAIEQYELTQAELKETRTELIQTAKLAMLGELSASINHEINQPLAAMRAYCENSLKLLQKERYDAVASNLEQLNDLNRRIADIIARFKVFARKGTQQNSSVNVASSIRNAIQLMQAPLTKHQVKLTLNLHDDILVNIDAVQFEQVMINLIQNAIQAQDAASEKEIGINLQVGRQRVIISIWDHGPGLDNTQKQRIFTPFFSTKHDGLGLGLTICRRILDLFSGSLTVHDHDGGGAEFRISLPLGKEEQQ